jgi:dTDP-4-amino-4,6-dideoxygalactose transaminase
VQVPLLDLSLQYRALEAEVLPAIVRVIESQAFVLGRAVTDFEQAFAAHHEAAECVAVSNGTSALHLALVALGIRPGDEVIVPANTFIATAEAVSLCGATPVFVDIDAHGFGLDIHHVARAVSERTRAVIPVHLYGQPVDMDALLEVARVHRLCVLEDCAQAHDAAWNGRKVGTFGSAGAFSFYPGKNLGAYGEAGAVLTNDHALAARMRMLRDHGSQQKYQHELIGFNYRMEGIQGAVLGVKLPYLHGWTERRRALAGAYRERLADAKLQLPPDDARARHVYHQFVVRVSERAEVMRALTERGVGFGLHYPVPLHRTPAYAALGYRAGDLPYAERASAEVLSLPMFPELTRAQLDYVCEVLTASVGRT